MIPKLKNKIATSSHILSLYKIHEDVNILGKTGYDSIEIWAQELEFQLKKKLTSIQKIKYTLKKNKMIGVIHCPLKNLLVSAPYKLNLCSKNKKLREESIKKNLQAIEFANKLGFEVITVHPGHTDFPKEKADNTYWKLQIDAFKKLAEKAEKLNVKIGIEPMEHRQREFIMDPPQVNRILKAVKSKNLGITFDLIHAHSHGVNKPIQYLDAHRKDIFHVHVSGHSKKKNHVPFHMSEISSYYLDKVLKKLVEYHKDIISIEGDIKGLMKETKTNQKTVVKKNLDYIHRELKSLHLI